MGSRGPKPLPTAILAKRNSWRQNENKCEPVPGRNLPPIPPGLTGIAKQVWEIYEPILYNMGVLTEVDGVAFEQLCKIYQQWKKYDDYLRRRGELQKVRDSKGRIREYKLHPYVKLRRDAQAQLDRCLANFGMTPSARSRISVDIRRKPPATPQQPNNPEGLSRIT